MEHQPLLDVVLALENLVDRLVDRGGLHRSEKAEVPHVHPEDRHPVGRRQASRLEEGAVSPDDECKPGPGEGLFAPREVGAAEERGRLAFEPDGAPVPLKAIDEPPSELQSFCLLGMGQQCYRVHTFSPALSSPATESSAVRLGDGGRHFALAEAPRSAPLQPKEELDVPFGPFDRRGNQPVTRPTVLPGRLDEGEEHPPVNAGIPHDASFSHGFAPRFKLRFHQCDHISLAVEEVARPRAGSW